MSRSQQRSPFTVRPAGTRAAPALPAAAALATVFQQPSAKSHVMVSRFVPVAKPRSQFVCVAKASSHSEHSPFFCVSAAYP